MAKVSGLLNTSHYKTEISNGRNNLIADEPATVGGTDLGFSPNDLLCSALVACTCITLRMYADRKEWDLEKVETSVSLEKTEGENSTTLIREIQLLGKLDLAQKKRLMEIAQQCPVHKILTNSIKINTVAI
ncbi:MAG: OsmC family protein [Bacteroidetes bacterium]|nr:OsmC family protein [Bacteroidota bacterium]